MPFQKFLWILLLAVFSSKGYAQQHELGKVTVAELEQKQHPKDTSATAAFLFRTAEVRIDYLQGQGFIMKTNVKTKIKIYKKEGYTWANNQIVYYLFGTSSEKVMINGATTYNLENGKITKSKLKNEEVFDENVNRYYGKKKIAMPNVKEGSIIEFEYTITSAVFTRLHDWNFQTSIPVNYSELKTYIPEFYVYKPIYKGFLFPKVTTEISSKKIGLTDKVGMYYAGQATYYYDNVDYQENRITYTAQNLPAMKAEAYVNNIDNYRAGVSHELSMIKMPNSGIKTYSNDWESVVTEIYNDDDFERELEKTDYFKNDIDALIKDLTAKDEIVNAILNYAKSSVKWNGVSSYYCYEGVKKAYKDKTGNAAEINLMLTAMLRYAGIDANPVVLSTRENGIVLFPTLASFNYVIAAVETESGRQLLDATEKYAMPNILPSRDLNWIGRLIKKDGSSEQVNLIPKDFSKQIVYMNLVVSSDATASGKSRKQFTGREALTFRQENLQTEREMYVEELENRNNAIEISGYVRENELDLPKPIVENYSFKDTRDIETINGKIYFSPLLYLTLKDNPFKQEKREYPIDFGNPSEIQFHVTINIPQGYIIESLPAPVSLKTADNTGSFKYNIVGSDSKIQLVSAFTMNTAIVSANDYETLRSFYQKMIDKQNEKIILIKKP
jgi:hypothetical protein